MLSAFDQLSRIKPVAQEKVAPTRESGWVQRGSLAWRIMQTLEDGKAWSVGNLAQALDAVHDSVRAALSRLEDKSLVVRVGALERGYSGPARPLFRRAKGGRL